MTASLLHAILPDGPRAPIHVLRLHDEILDYPEIDALAARMRAHLLARHGMQAATIVVVQGRSKETLLLFGEPYATGRVRAALFNAALHFSPIELA